MDEISKYRFFLKDTIRKSIDFRTSDQHRGVPAPPLEEKADDDQPRIRLPDISDCLENIPKMDISEAMATRCSRRRFTDDYLQIDELSFLLWATQGQRNPGQNAPHFRTVPSAGARHSFETYLFIHRVETVPVGLYRYLPVSHELIFIQPMAGDSKQLLSRAVFGQKFVADSAVVFVWTTIPYRMEWRYLQAAHRVILMDAGHVCQNLYLACEKIEAGTCAIAAYDQEAMDNLLGVDGEDQFTIYLAPVGKYRKSG